MIAWTGRGFSIILVYFLSALAFSPLFPGDTNGYPVISAAFVTAAFSWYFGSKWNNKVARTVIDEETGERLIFKDHHSLFWIKMQYWSIISSLFGIFILSKKSIAMAAIAFILFCALFTYIFILKRRKSAKEEASLTREPNS